MFNCGCDAMFLNFDTRKFMQQQQQENQQKYILLLQ